MMGSNGDILDDVIVTSLIVVVIRIFISNVLHPIRFKSFKKIEFLEVSIFIFSFELFDKIFQYKLFTFLLGTEYVISGENRKLSFLFFFHFFFFILSSSLFLFFSFLFFLFLFFFFFLFLLLFFLFFFFLFFSLFFFL